MTVQRSSDCLACLNETFEQKDFCFKEVNQSVISLCDTHPPHVANATQQIFLYMSVDVFLPTEYSPNLLYSDYHLYQIRKHFLYSHIIDGH